MAPETSKKLFYKIGEVCTLTETQPYVLRFWESEFPQLAPRKTRTGQRVYRPKDVAMVREIKKLLYDEGFTIAGARKKLGMEESELPSELLASPAEDQTQSMALLEIQDELRTSLQDILNIFDETDRQLK